MENINKIIDSLSPVEQNLMYNALQNSKRWVLVASCNALLAEKGED